MRRREVNGIKTVRKEKREITGRAKQYADADAKRRKKCWDHFE